MTKVTIAYTDDYLNWKLGSGDGSHPTNAIRAKLATEYLSEELSEYEIITPVYEPEDRDRLLEVHGAGYVSEVLDRKRSDEWDGVSSTNAKTAAVMFSGTVRLVEKMLAGETRIGFNPQGAKHHAHRNYSSGFCVFNDMAWAALEFAKAGLKVAYIDWDVHAGDGVQAILAKTEIPTFSIHGHGIFPNLEYTSLRGQTGNYLFANQEEHWYNYNLQMGEGDEMFAWAILDVEKRLEEYAPDVILLATGADGHESEYWGMQYTYAGYKYAAGVVADIANKYGSKVLIGGAGGYQPFTSTPRVWADVVKTIAKSVTESAN